jgi:zinc transporter 1/2/3
MDGEAEHGHDHQHPDVTPHDHGIVEGPSPVPSSPASKEKFSSYTEAESASSSLNPQYSTSTAEGVAQLIAVGILEFGVMLHSLIIGLTLGVTDEFIVLFVVLIFHQMFEGLGLGSRLSQLELPKHLRWAPWVAGILYSLMT